MKTGVRFIAAYVSNRFASIVFSSDECHRP